VLAQQLNEQCIELVCQLGTSRQQALPRFILRNRNLWCRLDKEARQRIAAFPFVILDLYFNDAEWLLERMGKSLVVLGCHRAVIILLETLLFARQSCREDASVAKAMFAMTSPAASLVASLTLLQVDCREQLNFGCGGKTTRSSGAISSPLV